MSGFTHFDDQGASRMVDVSGKASTRRTARASARIAMEPETLTLIIEQKMSKGDVFEVARLAGIMAAKQCGDLIPLCHPLGLDAVDLTLHPVPPGGVHIEATVTHLGRTGVEMEALTAVSIAALTVYDMCKAVDRNMVISAIQLEEKTGGRRGDYRRSPVHSPTGTANPVSGESSGLPVPADAHS